MEDHFNYNSNISKIDNLDAPTSRLLTNKIHIIRNTWLSSISSLSFHTQL